MQTMNCIFDAVLLLALTHSSLSYFSSPYTVLGPGGTFDIQSSPSQIETASTVNTVVIPGDPALDVPATSTIPNRYRCTNYTMLFTVPEQGDNPYKITLEIQLPGSVQITDKPECTIDWADGATEGPLKVDDLPMKINHTYSTFGVYPVSMTCEDDMKNKASCPSHSSECVTIADFLDNVYKQFQTPMIFLTTESILIKSYMEITSSSCGTPTITWRLTNVINATFTPNSNFEQSYTSVMSIEAGLLEPGEYVVSLEVLFPDKGSHYWSEDLVIIKVILPELVTYILGGELLDVVHGQEIFIDASISWDPAASLASEAALSLTASWSFLHFPNTPPESDMYLFLKEFPLSPLSNDYTTYKIGNGGEYALKIDTSLFTSNTYAVAMFTLSRGQRISSAMQMIRFVENALPISIE